MAASTIRIATRRSDLAMAQATEVLETVRALSPEHTFTLVPMDSDGDATTGRFDPARRGMFASALEAAIVDGDADAAVHSLKDVAEPIADGTQLAAYLPREDPADVLVGRLGPDTGAGALARIHAGARVGTASSRRQAQIAHVRPDVTCELLRGNVPRRIQAARSGEFDAVVLAAAGLNRLGLQDEADAHISVREMVPEPGQGAVVVQARTDLAPVFASLDHAQTRAGVMLERHVAAALGGGCETPIGVHLTDRTLLIFAAAADASTAALDTVPLTQAELDEPARWSDVAARARDTAAGRIAVGAVEAR